MAGRGRASSQKRQKEQLRLERRQEKAAKKQARKDGLIPDTPDDEMDQAEDRLDMAQLDALAHSAGSEY